MCLLLSMRCEPTILLMQDSDFTCGIYTELKPSQQPFTRVRVIARDAHCKQVASDKRTEGARTFDEQHAQLGGNVICELMQIQLFQRDVLPFEKLLYRVLDAQIAGESQQHLTSDGALISWNANERVIASYDHDRTGRIVGNLDLVLIIANETSAIGKRYGRSAVGGNDYPLTCHG